MNTRGLLVAFVIVVSALDASGAEPYRFHLDATGRTFRLTSKTGARWKALMFRCGPTTTECRFQFNHARGSGVDGDDTANPYDIRLAGIAGDTVVATSLREACRIRVAGRDRMIKRGEHLRLNVGSEVEVECE